MRYSVTVKPKSTYRVISDGQTNRHLVSMKTRGDYNIRMVEPAGIYAVVGRASCMNVLNVEDLANVLSPDDITSRYVLIYDADQSKWVIRALESSDLPRIDGGYF
jgi:hypothetical protein